MLPSDPDNLTVADKEKKKVKVKITKNDLAIACLTMEFQGEENLEYVEDSSTTAYPNGIATEVVKDLKENYNPTNQLSAVETATKMSAVTLSPTDDPDSYFKRVAVV